MSKNIKLQREKIKVPRSVQKSIPIKRIYRDGIFETGKFYSKSWSFQDVNYAIASYEDQLELFMSYCGLLNALAVDATTKITIHNRHMNPQQFEDTILMQRRGDSLDRYRNEYNDILRSKAADSNNIVQEKYFTVSVHKRNADEARTFFSRVNNDFAANLRRMSSKCVALNAGERLQALHSFYRPEDVQHYNFDLLDTIRKGHDFKDYICPDSLEYKADHFKMGKKFGRVLFLREYASFIKDSMISELCDLNKGLMLSIDILPVPTDEAVKELTMKVMGVEGDITRWQQRTNANNNFSAQIPYELELSRNEAKEYLDDISVRDQRMMFATVTLVHTADSLEELDTDTDTLLAIARKHLCTLAPLRFQQEDALNTVLPIGLRKIEVIRSLTTEALGVLCPFTVQEIQHPHGIFYGKNAVSGNLIICDRSKLINPHGFYLGSSGSGKSMATKFSIASIIMNTNDDCIILDAEREYGPLVRAMGFDVIDVSAASANHINALDMSKDYAAGDNPIIAKSEFVLSLCEQLMGAGQLRAKEKSLIDRCTANIYRKYVRHYEGEPPTLQDFHAELMRQPEPEAQEIALAVELFTTGSLNVFSHQTNVDTKSRVLAYDLLDLGKALKTIGMLVVLDSVLNRVTANREAGKRTHIFIDELHLYFANEYSANFLAESWKRLRKYGGQCTGITQNVEDCLRSPMGRGMLANSEFLVLLNQSATDREQLSSLLSISETQLSYITNADVGRGLIKVGPSIVPFVNEIPRDTDIYRLISTKPGEG